MGWRAEKKSIDLGVHCEVACCGGGGISYRMSRDKDDGGLRQGVFIGRNEPYVRGCIMLVTVTASDMMNK